MFQVGDMVCYPMHGVGTVEAIQEQNILGETNQYYLLRFLMGRMTALVPVKNAQSVGLRPLIDEGTYGKVVEFLKSDDCSQESDNWNQRYRENLDKLKQGDALVVADVVKRRSSFPWSAAHKSDGETGNGCGGNAAFSFEIFLDRA